MIHRVAMLSLALMAAVGLSAVASSLASAASFRVTTAPAVLTGTTEEGSTEKFTASGITVSCHGEYRATQSTTSSEALTVKPQYSKCSSSATVNTEHCAYVLNATTDVNGHGHVDIECAAGSTIKLEVPSICNLDFGAQTGLTKGVKYTNVGENRLSIKATVENVVFSKTSGPLCAFVSGTGKYESLSVAECFGDSKALTDTEKTTFANYAMSETKVDCEKRT